LYIFCSVFVVAGVFRAEAAELRVSFSELTALIRTIAANTKVHLNTAPALLPIFTIGSSISVGGSQNYPLDVKTEPFGPLTQKIYIYDINDISSTEVSVRPVKGALRLTIKFESENPEAVPRCLVSECKLINVMPDVEWDNASVMIDFVPIQFGGGISLRVVRVRLGGAPRPVCRDAGGFFSRTFCRAGMGYARREIAKLKAKLPGMIKDSINTSGVQERFADGLRQYLKVGESGEVAINRISIAPSNVNVNFKFSVASTSGN
jgi:hypothetical protein